MHGNVYIGDTMTLDRLKALVSHDFDAVNKVIIEKIHSKVGLIDELSYYIIESGGKRLRPLLVLLSSYACGYRGQNHISLAAMVEFFHTATLLHDDVVDASDLRRGHKTANNIWGSKASVLVGDYLVTLSLQVISDIGNWPVFRLMSDTSTQIVTGEIKQLSNRHNTSLSTEEYFEVIRSKTALLFAASAAIGGLLGGVDEELQRAMYQYGLHLGNAFQLIDDALDYSSDAKTIGKNIGDDLSAGMATLPLIHVLQHGSAEEQQLIQQSLKEGSLDQLPRVLKAIEANNSIEFTKQFAAKEVDHALAALESLPSSVYKEALVDLAHFAVQRAY